MSDEAEDLEVYRARARAWLAEHLPEREVAEGRGGQLTPEQEAAERARQREVYEAGWLGIDVPEEYGGQGLTPAHQRVWQEESARYAVPTPGGIATHVTLGIILPTLLACASEEQKRDWIPKLLSGEEIWCQLLSEPGAGSDLAGLLTRATRDGDSWVLNGAKVWSSGALQADYGVCLARTDWDVPKHRGLTWFKVPLHDPRVTVRPIREINGGAEFCEEVLDDVVVGDDAVIGEVNGGWPIANVMLAYERQGVGGVDPGRAGGGGGRRGLPADLVALATARGLEGDGAVRQLIAGVHVDEWAQAQLVKRVVEQLRHGSGDPASASLIKLSRGINDPRRAAAAMEVAGRTAIAWEEDGDDGHAAALAFLNGRVMSIAGGSDQIQRNIISERLLGLPREPSDDRDRPFREVLRDARSWGQRG